MILTNIKVKIRLLNSETLLAQATVIFDDLIETHGWKILRSIHMHPKFQENIWIQAPSYKPGGTWKEIVYITDRKLHEEIQDKIYDAYHMAKTKKLGLEGVRQMEEETIVTI